MHNCTDESNPLYTLQSLVVTQEKHIKILEDELKRYKIFSPQHRGEKMELRNELHCAKDAHEMAVMIKDAIKKYYGVDIILFVSKYDQTDDGLELVHILFNDEVIICADRKKGG